MKEDGDLVDEIRDAIEKLQRDFIVALLTTIDPDIGNLRTTMAELERRSLTGEPYFDDDPY